MCFTYPNNVSVCVDISESKTTTLNCLRISDATDVVGVLDEGLKMTALAEGLSPVAAVHEGLSGVLLPSPLSPRCC